MHNLFRWLLQNDQVTNDLTTNSLFPTDHIVTASLITRQGATIAGIEEITYLIKTFTQLKITAFCKDRDTLQSGDQLLTIQGNLKELLAYERVMLNILQRLSGIATETHLLISEIEKLNLKRPPYIAATRKTVWGYLDKKAVAMGGGLTHRLDLADGILVKDNHLMLASPKEILQTLLQTVEKTLIEIEVEDEASLQELVTDFEGSKSSNALAILLDNFTPAEAKQILTNLDRKRNIVFEASGGITKENILDWAQTGVDIISLGALTHSSKSANFSLEIEG